MSPRSPCLARAILRALTPREDRPFVLADLDERFERVRLDGGPRSARWWYRRQALVSTPVLVANRAAELARGLRAGEIRRIVRALLRRPQYAAGVAGTLALGFASAMVLGGLAWQVWLQPLPLPDSERLVRVYELEPVAADGERVRFPVSPPFLDALRAREWRHFTGFAGILGSSPEWVVDGDTRHLTGAIVSPGFFEVLGITPLHGRAEFRGRDGEAGAEVVLTEEFWVRAFGGDPGVVGGTVHLASGPHTVVGVVPQNGEYPETVDLFTPLLWASHQLAAGFRGARYVEAVGRVAPGSDIDVASDELATFVAGLGEAWPDSHVDWSAEVVSLRADLVRPFRPALRLLLAAGFAFLALSVVNVFGLSMARALERSRESAVRIALGASRARLARGALVEGAALGLAGGIAALVLARILTAVSVGWLPATMPRTTDLGASPLEAAAWLGCAVVGGAVMVALARRLVPPADTPMSGARVSRDLVGGRAIVVGQFALTTLLVGVGTLAIERSVELAHRDLGYRVDGVWVGLVALPQTANPDSNGRRDAWSSLLRELESGGYAAAISTNPPMARTNNRFDYRRSAEDEQKFGQYAIVSHGYFDLMEIPFVEGRTFTRGDSTPSVIISETLAEEVYPGESPLGLTLSILQQDREIVGVVGSAAHFGPDRPAPPMMYASYEAENWAFSRLVVAGGDAVVGAVEEAMNRAIPGAAPVSMVPYERHVSEWFRPLRIQLGIVGALAVVGGLLASLGLYSAIAFQVRGRMPELGIRMALGATGASIAGRVVRGGLSLAGIGLAGGFMLWWLGRRALSEAMGASASGVSATSVGATALTILGLALAAVAIPARRAAEADPLETFRGD